MYGADIADVTISHGQRGSKKNMKHIQQALGELVTALPAAAKVFQRYRLDYYCHGKQSLFDACSAAGVEVKDVLRDIEEIAQLGLKNEERWDECALDALIQHVLDRYHTSLRSELPRLMELASRVERAHAEQPDYPKGLADLLYELRVAIEGHLNKEEQILFPLIIANRARNAYMPVQVMMQEHDDHGQNLQRIRELTGDLAVPPHACATWQELYRGLGELELELMDHIHLENNILFSRALVG